MKLNVKIFVKRKSTSLLLWPRFGVRYRKLKGLLCMNNASNALRLLSGDFEKQHRNSAFFLSNCHSERLKLFSKLFNES